MASIGTEGRWARHGGNWGWILAYGLLLVVIGVFALIEPLATGFATGLFVAALLICAGVAALAAGFSARGWHSRWLDIATGILALLLGGLSVWHPFLGAISVVWMIGFWLFLSGLLELTAGFGVPGHRGLLLLLGVIDLALGLYLFIAGPMTALIVLAVLIGFSFISRGVMLSILAFRLRRLLR